MTEIGSDVTGEAVVAMVGDDVGEGKVDRASGLLSSVLPSVTVPLPLVDLSRAKVTDKAITAAIIASDSTTPIKNRRCRRCRIRVVRREMPPVEVGRE